MENAEKLIEKVSQPQIWDKVPVFCFTCDIDWASEDVMKRFFKTILPLDLKPTLFLTHHSKEIEKVECDKGIHPNFLPGSSHGNSFEEVIEYLSKGIGSNIAGVRSHRGFEVTDTAHLLHERHYRYSSNCITIMQPNIRPVLHESGLINYPVFWEDGTHLYNKLDLDFMKYLDQFTSPGIKIISFHPMNFVMNSPSLQYMREIKDLLSREEYQNITESQMLNLENNSFRGIRDTTLDIISWVKRSGLKIMSLEEIYKETIR